jgi:lipopolysaccharide/colanic/teichoic acid biosynthesis glycosyltransferase
MVKLRSMVVRADRTGVDSTAASDPRITRMGRLIRKLKLDELTQLWNVLWGQMSLVGPRPNVERETRLYSDLEKGLLSVRPGITDLASIVFADEGEILQGQPDPDLAYNQLIRPWKSRLGLFAIDHQSLIFDLYQVFLTLLGALSRRAALALVSRALRRRGAEEALWRVALRQDPLMPTPPPGLDQLVTSRAK